MSVVRYISDLHLSHLNMAKRRGFEIQTKIIRRIIKWIEMKDKRIKYPNG